MTHSVSSPILVALDYPDMASAIVMAKQLDPRQCRVKVGKELYTRSGPAVLEQLHQLGFEVFLDLKFHDIPNTTASAVAVASVGASLAHCFFHCHQKLDARIFVLVLDLSQHA